MDPRVEATLDRLYTEDAAQRAANLPSSHRTRNIDRESGRWLGLLVRTTGAREIVEMGSSNAVSTIWLAEAVRDHGGRVTGTEILPNRAADANRNLAEAGLEAVARIVPGDAREIARTVAGPIDLVFIDAEKDDYVDHLLAVLDRIRPGGLILADNVTSHDISAYQDFVRAHDDLETVTIPIARGIEFTVKRA
jgi:predicted O-methyltransferase YrrM